MPLTHCALTITSLFCILHDLCFVYFKCDLTRPPVVFSHNGCFALMFNPVLVGAYLFFQASLVLVVYPQIWAPIAKYYSENEVKSQVQKYRKSCICIIYKDIFCVLKWRLVVYEICSLNVTLCKETFWCKNLTSIFLASTIFTLP